MRAANAASIGKRRMGWIGGKSGSCGVKGAAGDLDSPAGTYDAATNCMPCKDWLRICTTYGLSVDV